MEGVMVPTAPGPLGPRPFTCSVGHLHTLLNLAVLFLAQPGDPPGQHAPMWPDELTEQQNILVETEDGRGGSWGWVLAAREPGPSGLQGRLL